MNYEELTGHTIREGFMKFHKENPYVYKAFEKQALKAISNGRTKISAKLIINWIRWNEFLETNDTNFKINDAFHSYYARLFVEKNPSLKDCFEFRKLRNEYSGPYMDFDENGQLKFL